jgi:hypothetical protein
MKATRRPRQRELIEELRQVIAGLSRENARLHRHLEKAYRLAYQADRRADWLQFCHELGCDPKTTEEEP